MYLPIADRTSCSIDRLKYWLPKNEVAVNHTASKLQLQNKSTYAFQQTRGISHYLLNIPIQKMPQLQNGNWVQHVRQLAIMTRPPRKERQLSPKRCHATTSWGG